MDFNKNKPLLHYIKRDKQLIVMSIPLILFYFIFAYIPMYGAIIAFKNYIPSLGIMGSPWAGFKYFIEFFSGPFFIRTIRNTFLLGIYTLIFSFFIPIVFALCINEIKNKHAKKIIQTTSYLPYFISVVVIVGLMSNMLSPHYGVVNKIFTSVTGKAAINFMTEKAWFRPLYVISAVWQTFGWNSIIYLAALSGVNQELFESARIDGASRFKQILHVSVPSIMPTIIIMLILNIGNIMATGHEKVLLMYSPSTYQVADIISTFTYRSGIENLSFSFGAAVGLFNSVINVSMIVLANQISKKVSDVSLW